MCYSVCVFIGHHNTLNIHQTYTYTSVAINMEKKRDEKHTIALSLFKVNDVNCNCCLIYVIQSLYRYIYLYIFGIRWREWVCDSEREKQLTMFVQLVVRMVLCISVITNEENFDTRPQFQKQITVKANTEPHTDRKF